MSAVGMIATTLATDLLKALAADIAEGQPPDFDKGTFGPRVSGWLREVAELCAEVREP